jgi:hypothetical protein
MALSEALARLVDRAIDQPQARGWHAACMLIGMQTMGASGGGRGLKGVLRADYPTRNFTVTQ